MSFSAAAAGGVGPYQYKFMFQFPGQSVSTTRDWSSNPTYAIAFTSPTSFSFIVWARSAGVTADAPQAQASLSYSINPAPSSGPMLSINMSTDIGSPRPLGTTIRVTAGGYGGATPYQFKYFVNGSVARDWGSETWLWTPSAGGSYTIGVWGRAAGSSADQPQATSSFPFTITQPASTATMTSVHLNVALGSPQYAGTSIGLTASGAGGVAPYQYRFLIKQGTADYQVARDWSTSSSYTWTPNAAANYRITLQGRSAGSNSDTGEASEETYFATTQTAIKEVTFTADRASGSSIGPVTFTAAPFLGKPPHEYYWVVRSPTGVDTVLRSWSTATSVTWNPPAVGTYVITVRGRSVSDPSFEATFQKTYVVN